MKQCTVFDIDGTLFDNKELTRSCWKAHGIGHLFDETWGKTWNSRLYGLGSIEHRQRTLASKAMISAIEAEPSRYIDYIALDIAKRVQDQLLLLTAGGSENALRKLRVLKYTFDLKPAHGVWSGAEKLSPRTWQSVRHQFGDIVAIYDDCDVWEGVRNVHVKWRA